MIRGIDRAILGRNIRHALTLEFFHYTSVKYQPCPHLQFAFFFEIKYNALSKVGVLMTIPDFLLVVRVM